MADIGVALRAKLVGTSAVAALLGTRVYPDHIPQTTTVPAAVYYAISGVEEGSLTGNVGLSHVRLQVDSYAATRLAANVLATAIRDAVTSQTGSRGTWGTVSVCGCSVAGGERHDEQPKADGSDEPFYITSRDFLVSFIE